MIRANINNAITVCDGTPTKLLIEFGQLAYALNKHLSESEVKDLKAIMDIAAHAKDEHEMADKVASRLFISLVEEKTIEKGPEPVTKEDLDDIEKEINEALGTEEETISLNTEDIEYLLHKAEKAEDKGNFISVSWSGKFAGVYVYIMHGKFETGKKYDAVFNFRTNASGLAARESREEYNECIAYLEKLAGEEDDN